MSYIYHCCMYSEKLLMMDRGTVRNIYSFIKKKFVKLLNLVGFIIRITMKLGKSIASQCNWSTQLNFDSVNSKYST